MIILEGSDLTGKTTTANRLCKLMAARRGIHEDRSQELYRHMSKPPEDFDHMIEYGRVVRAGVQDRFHLGSIVYGAMLGQGTYVSAAKMAVIQRHLSWQGCVVIIMHGGREWLRERISQSSKAEMYSPDQILTANECFRLLVKSRNRGLRYCDFDHNCEARWPTDDDLNQWLDAWFQRWN